MATLTAPKNKVFKPKALASTTQLSEAELWDKAAAAMQQMAVNATALADTAAGLVVKLDVINAQLTGGGSCARR